MANSGLQLMGFALAFLGWIGIITSTALPQWKTSSYAGENIVTAQSIYEGLWISCVSQSTGQVQCKVYDSMLKLDSTLQATRALMIISILLGTLAILIASAGMKCTTCFGDDKAKKGKVATVGGVMFLISGLAALVATAWYGNNIAKEFYNPFTPTNSRFEFGQALFIGWAAAALSILGGAFLCCSCTKGSRGSYPGQTYPRSQSASSAAKNYV
ncbi:claudin-1-like [Carcharodon carcharias]|uniref:claudin-1-like n=1 Tax=Carcharodon carcharias TaxID=13397 RepID=UPI001B7E1801|nr:claudin-1-like [Carcharodon carcharias]XP_041034602.1 claudin-1-like [Carcharodon carcharias]